MKRFIQGECRGQPCVAQGQLIPVLPEYPGPVLPIHVIWPRGRYLPARVRVVIDALVEALADSE
jgi:DNA-binding transcriptional LysR family regulator